jgi:hypothetical protein
MEDQEFPKTTKAYLHSTKEDMRMLGEKLGLEGEALEKFVFALYEVKFVLEVNEDGSYKILSARE